MRQLLLAAPILLVLLTSGCTSIPCIPGLTCGGTNEETHDVIVIESLQAIPDDVAPGSTINLVAIVSNVAGIDAPQTTTDVCVELYDYCSGLFQKPGVKTAKDSKAQIQCGDAGIAVNLLRGEKKQLEWTLKAEDKEKVPVKTQCELKLRAIYEYTTESITTLHLINYAEMQRRINEGTFKEEASYISTGYGPIKPYIRVEGSQPIPVTDRIMSTALSIQIENKGRGFLSEGPIKDPSGSSVPKSVTQPHIKKTDLVISDTGSAASVTVKLNECVKGFDSEIKLIKGESVKLPCPMDNVNVGNVPVDSTKTLKATISKYWYEFRNSVKVTVEPKY